MTPQTASTNQFRPLLKALLVGFGGATAAGVAIGAAIYELLDTNSTQNDWADLGAALFAFAGGLLVAAIFFAVGFRNVRRAAPADRRAFVVTTYLISPIAVWFVLGNLGIVVPWQWIPLVLALPILAILAVAGVLNSRWVIAGALLLAIAFAAGAARY